jgi:aryl-alcohol dehydrogenase-like predicted oxidoreductase
MGRAIKGLPREALVISSKVFWPTMPGPNGRGLSRKHVVESVNASLRRLGVEYLDLYYCHRFDPDTPVDEIVWTMNDLLHQGKILYWGTSEWEAVQVTHAIGIAHQLNLVGPTMEQPQYNLFHRRRVEIELASICREFGIGLTTFSPLSYGILSGKYNDGIPDGSRASLPEMAWIRDAHVRAPGGDAPAHRARPGAGYDDRATRHRLDSAPKRGRQCDYWSHAY